MIRGEEGGDDWGEHDLRPPCASAQGGTAVVGVVEPLELP